MTYTGKLINFNTMPVDEPSDDGLISNSEYDENENIAEVVAVNSGNRVILSVTQPEQQDVQMEDCTSSDKKSNASSGKKSFDRVPHRERRNARRVVDQADSEDEKVLFGSAKNNLRNQHCDQNKKICEENRENKLEEQDILFGNSY